MGRRRQITFEPRQTLHDIHNRNNKIPPDSKADREVLYYRISRGLLDQNFGADLGCGNYVDAGAHIDALAVSRECEFTHELAVSGIYGYLLAGETPEENESLAPPMNMPLASTPSTPFSPPSPTLTRLE